MVPMVSSVFTAESESTMSTGAVAGQTLRLTVAVLESKVPSLTLKVKLSAPVAAPVGV